MYCFVVFFCFNQKTSYEIRSRDWSSDVCSSDLVDDCAFPLVTETIASADPMEAFDGTDYALLVGARPRGPGMERKDLLEANAKIFSVQGKALSEKASRDVRSEEHTSELQSLMRISYAVFCLKKKNKKI